MAHQQKVGLWGMPKVLQTQYAFFLALLLFVGLLVVLPTEFIPSELGGTTLTITTFLFGIIAGFFIYVTSTDYTNVKNVLAAETSGWIALYRSVSMYDPAAIRVFAERIDAYLRRAFDFEIIDYARSTVPEFEAASEVVRNLPYRADRSSIHQVIMGELDAITLARQQLIGLGTKSLSAFSWMVLFALGALVIGSLYGLRTGEVFFDVVTVFIASSVILLLLLIRDLDLYIWNERTFGFEMEMNLFHSIGELPYYPEESIVRGRVHPPESVFRVGVFVDYPRSNVRKIEIRNRV
ncbi:MAG: hypothetical protein Q7S02_01800 [bacterium]|nr:hypothetical protein [bacterium]